MNNSYPSIANEISHIWEYLERLEASISKLEDIINDKPKGE